MTVRNKKSMLGLAVMTTGLSAGLFYAYSVSVNPAFTRLSDAQYVAAMQSINDAIQNPIFFLSFFGAAILLPLTAYLYRDKQKTSRYKLLVIASALYIVGVFGVTISANVPLNDKLAKVPITATAEELAAARADFSETWNKWHTLRTVAAIATLGVIVSACLVTRSGKKETV